MFHLSDNQTSVKDGSHLQNVQVPPTCSDLQCVIQQKSDWGDEEKNVTLEVFLGSSEGEPMIQWSTEVWFWLEPCEVVYWSRFGPCSRFLSFPSSPALPHPTWLRPPVHDWRCRTVKGLLELLEVTHSTDDPVEHKEQSLRFLKILI